MAIIKTIRDKYAKLAGVVIGIALLGFVLMDFGSGGGGSSDTIAKVNGTKISYAQYENLIQQREQEVRMQNPSMSVSEVMRAQLRDQAWEDIINQELLGDLYKDLGITVSEAEINDLLYGSNPDPMVRQAFTNPETGTYDPQQVRQMVQQMENDPEQRDMWKQFQNEIVNRRYVEKLNTLIVGGVYMPTFFAQKQSAIEGTQSEGEVVMLPYSLVADSEVEISDKDLQDYIQKNAAFFTNKEELRSIEYVSFVTIPSSQDTIAALGNAQDLLEEFKNITGSELTSFLALHESATSLPHSFFTQEQISTLDNGDAIWNASSNEVVGPFFEDDQIWMTKTTEKVTMPNSVTSQHIFVASEIQGSAIKSMEAAKSSIDSAIAQINAGVSFAEVAAAVSDDNLAEAGGKHTFSPQERGFLSDKFANALYNNPVNSKQVIEVNDGDMKGYYYLEVLEKGETVDTYHKIAFVNQSFDADKNTISDIYNAASTFMGRIQDGEDFRTVAQEMGKTVRTSNNIKRFSHLIPSVGASMELGRWTQDAKMGDHSSIIDVDDQFIIATLTDVQPKGLFKINESNKALITSYVMKDKKAAKLAEMYNSSSSLSDIASKTNQEVIPFEGVSFAQPFVPGIGQEPKAVGYASNVKHVGKLSPGIYGNNGVIYMNVSNATPGSSESANKQMMLQQMQQQYSNNALPTLTEQLNQKASIKDSRDKIYR